MFMTLGAFATVSIGLWLASAPLLKPACGELKILRREGPMPLPSIPASMLPIVLLTFSNVFMTFAWYGHLRFKEYPLALVIFVS
jgi:hypothetical protein